MQSIFDDVPSLEIRLLSGGYVEMSFTSNQVSVYVYNSKGRMTDISTFRRSEVIGWYCSLNHKKRNGGYFIGFERRGGLVNEYTVVNGNEFVEYMKKNDFLNGASDKSVTNGSGTPIS